MSTGDSADTELVLSLDALGLDRRDQWLQRAQDSGTVIGTRTRSPPAPRAGPGTEKPRILVVVAQHLISLTKQPEVACSEPIRFNGSGRGIDQGHRHPPAIVIYS